MSSIDIYSILRSKSDNDHMINRYIKFISICMHMDDDYAEDHHICPKAVDLFPEYADFKHHPWNLVRLTARQHIIAHIMLWKIFRGSQTTALYYILNVQNESTGYNLRKIPSSIYVRYAALLREEIGINRKNKAVYKDFHGNRFLLHKDDPKINELNLVGNNLGHTHSDEAKQRMSDAKYPNKVVRMYFLDCETSVKLFSDEFSEYLAQGWTTNYSVKDMQWVSEQKYTTVSKKMKGRTRYCLPNGSYYGMLYKDDPKIKELNLQVQYTENNKAQLESIRGLAAEALVGTQIYNNGISEARFIDSPTDPQWKLGRLPRSDEHSKNQKEAARKAGLGTKFWNNGRICIKVPKDQNPGEEWVAGMLKRK